MTVPSASSPPSALSVFRNRSFTLMWLGQLVSSIGSSLTSLAAGILVYRLTGSALSVGLMLMATAIPTLLVGLIAGVFVDRYDRKRIMIWANLIQGGLVCLIPFVTSSDTIWPLYLIVLLSAAVGQFFDPAHESVLPEVATDEELAAANSLMAISSFGSTAVGFAASGFLASLPGNGIDIAFFVDGATFFFSAVCIALVRVAPLTVEGKTTVSTVFRNLGAGAKFLRDTPILRSLLGIRVPVLVVFGLQNVLLLPFAIQALHATEFEYGLQEGLTSLAFAAGSFMLASLADRLREGQWLTISYLGMALSGMAYAQAPAVAATLGIPSAAVPFAIVMVMISGFMNAPSFIAGRLIVQRNTPRDMRGRVASTMYVTRDVVYMVGMGLAALADYFPVQDVFFYSSVALLLVGVVSFFLPGLGQPTAEWKRAIQLLRGAKAAPRLGMGRAATLADFDLLATRISAFSALSAKERQDLAAQTLVADAPGGTVVIHKGEVSDNAYFILSGQAVAGYVEGDDYQLLEVLNPGDFFGEIAAITGRPRTANVITEEATTLLQVPAPALRGLTSHPDINRVFLSKMTERMARMNLLDLPRVGGLDQQVLRELRTVKPEPQSA